MSKTPQPPTSRCDSKSWLSCEARFARLLAFAIGVRSACAPLRQMLKETQSAPSSKASSDASPLVRSLLEHLESQTSDETQAA